MCAKVQSCSYPFVPIHSSSRDGPSSPYPKVLSPRALFTAAPVAVLPLHELSLPCCSLFSANSLSRALPPSMWRKFFSIHGSEPGRLGGVCYSPRARPSARHRRRSGTPRQRSRARARHQHGCAWGAPEDTHCAVRLFEETYVKL